MKKTEEQIEEYVPYGPEWEKELLKWPKIKLIRDFIKQLAFEKNLLKGKLKGKEVELTELEAQYEKAENEIGRLQKEIQSGNDYINSIECGYDK